MASPAPDLTTAHVHFASTNAGSYVLDLSFTEFSNQAVSHGPPDTPPGHVDQRDTDESWSPPGHAKDHEADPSSTVAGFGKPGNSSPAGDHGWSAGDDGDARAADQVSQAAWHEPPGHAKDRDADETSSSSDFNKSGNAFSTADDHRSFADDNSNSRATETAWHGSHDTPPGHAKDHDLDQSSLVADVSKPGNAASATANPDVFEHDNADQPVTEAARHGPSDTPPGHAKDHDADQSALVADVSKPGNAGSAGVGHGLSGHDNADSPLTDAAVHGPHDIPPAHAKDSDADQSVLVADMTSPAPDQFPFRDTHGNPHAIAFTDQAKSHGPQDVSVAMADGPTASPLFDATPVDTLFPDHFQFGPPHTADIGAGRQLAVPPGQATPHLSSDDMPLTPIDQFHFSDLDTGHKLPAGHLAEFDPQPVALQEFIDATTPDHPANGPAHDAAPIPGMDVTASPTLQVIAHAHAHGGLA
jgi:hypothetical protein